MDVKKYEQASAAAQGVLRTVSPTLLVDGKFGTTTQKAYDSADASIKGTVERVVQALGLSVKDLIAYQGSLRDTAKSLSAGGVKYVSRVDVDALVRRASATLGRPELAEKVMGFVDLEAAKKVIDGMTYYNTLSVSPNGLYKGLFQMGQAAWADATVRLSRVGYTLPIFAAGWANPEYSVFAGVAYAAANADALISRNIPVTAQTLYAAHNQGVGGFSSYVKSGTVKFPGQSAEALRVLAQARQQSMTA